MDNSSRRRALGIQPADFFLPAILAVLAIGLAVFQARFYNHLNLLNVTRNTAVLTLVGGAQAFVIISGGFDVSIGAVVAFTSVGCAIVMGSAAAGLGPDLAAMLGVPASKRAGGPWNCVRSKVTSRIMFPPPCQGGMCSSTAPLP